MIDAINVDEDDFKSIYNSDEYEPNARLTMSNVERKR